MLHRRRITYFMCILMLFVFSMGGEILAAGTTDGSLAKSNNSSTFKDVSAQETDSPYIYYIANKGIISGFPDGTYHPQDVLTRAQAAVVICKAISLKTPGVESTVFQDVPAGHWSSSYIDAAAKAGYIKGFPDGTYKPDDKLTRAQAISLIMRICTKSERASLPILQDMDNQHWAAVDMGTAFSLGMIQTSQDGKQIYPDNEMTRSGMARALAILLTKDPGLNQVKLTGKLTEIKGDVTLTRSGKALNPKDGIAIYEADVIKTGGSGQARLMFPDGSGNLLEGNCEIVIKKADGKSYIKQDGTPGIAVDFLDIELKKGTLFGALSTKTGGKTENSQASLSSRLASREPLRQLAATSTQPWYKTAQEKKVRMKVDMPWGVAAVRGTFIKVSVNPDGTCKVCCLSGNAETSSNTGSVAVNGGESAVIQSESSQPSKGGLSAADKAEMENQQAWIVNTALQMDANRAVEVLVDVDNETSVQTILDALQDAGIQLKAEVIEQLKEDMENLDLDIVENNDSKSNDTRTSDTRDGNTNNVNINVAYNLAGTYGGVNPANMSTINGSAIINASGVTLQNMVISGDLLLSASIGEGDVTLQNVIVQGTTTINGGGSGSIHLVDCQLATVTVSKVGSTVRVVASGTTTVGPLTVNSAVILQESELTGSGFSEVLTGLNLPAGTQIVFRGNFSSINISSPGLVIKVESGSIGQINLASSAIGTSINLASGVTVSSLLINADGIVVDGSGVIGSLTIAEGITANIGGNDITGPSGSYNDVVDITIDNYNLFTEAILTAQGEPLSQESWTDIFELIYDNTGPDNTYWISADPEYLDYSINPDGTSMALTYGYEGSARIYSDFIIPASLVVDLDGNPAKGDIVIDSMNFFADMGGELLGTASSGGISSITPYVSYCGTDDKAYVKAYQSDGEGGYIWNEIKFVDAGANSQDIKLVKGRFNTFAALLDKSGNISLQELAGDGWNYRGTPLEGAQGSLLDMGMIMGEEDMPVLACQAKLPDETYTGIVARYTGSQWLPYISGESGGIPFFSQSSSVLALQLCVNLSDCYVAYVDANDQLIIKGDVEVDGYGEWQTLVSQSLSAIGGFNPNYEFSMVMSGTDLILSWVDHANKIKVVKYQPGASNVTDMSPVPVIYAGSSSVQIGWIGGSLGLLYTSGPSNKPSMSVYSDSIWLTPPDLKTFGVPVADGKDTMVIDQASSYPTILLKGKNGRLHYFRYEPR